MLLAAAPPALPGVGLDGCGRWDGREWTIGVVACCGRRHAGEREVVEMSGCWRGEAAGRGTLGVVSWRHGVVSVQ